MWQTHIHNAYLINLVHIPVTLRPTPERPSEAAAGNPSMFETESRKLCVKYRLTSPMSDDELDEL